MAEWPDRRIRPISRLAQRHLPGLALITAVWVTTLACNAACLAAIEVDESVKPKNVGLRWLEKGQGSPPFLGGLPRLAANPCQRACIWECVRVPKLGYDQAKAPEDGQLVSG